MREVKGAHSLVGSHTPHLLPPLAPNPLTGETAWPKVFSVSACPTLSNSNDQTPQPGLAPNWFIG